MDWLLQVRLYGTIENDLYHFERIVKRRTIIINVFEVLM